MGYGLSLVTGPAVEPLTLQEAKAHLRITESDEDAWIENLIKAVRQRAENATNRQLVTATWKLVLDAFPTRWRVTAERYMKDGLGTQWGAEITIPKTPLQSITTIDYIDEDGNSQTLAASEYVVSTDREPAVVRRAFGKDWPSTRLQPDAVEITFVAGYGATGETVPDLLKSGMLLTLGHLYENREDVIAGTTARMMPEAAKSIYEQYSYGDEFAHYG